MQKHGTPSYTHTLGQLAAFLGAGTKALALIADDLSPELLKRWTRDGMGMQSAFLKAFSPDNEKTVPLTDLFRDLLPEGWEVVENVEEEPVSISELELVSFLKEGETFIKGEEMCRRAKKVKASPGLGQARRFLKEEKKAPREWRRYYLPLPGARVRTPGGRLRVPYLGWFGDGWDLHFDWLDGGWDAYGRLLRRK